MWKTGQFADTKHTYVSKNVGPSFFICSLLFCLTVLMTACAGPFQTTNSSPNTNAASPSIKIMTQAGPASVGVPYNAVTTVSGASAPYSFKISSGSLPPGTSLNPATGSIIGTPSVAGTYDFVLSVSSSRATGGVSPVYVLATSRLSTPLEPSPVEPSGMSGSTPVQIVVFGSSAASMVISPNAAVVPALGQQQFTALFSGTANTTVKWSASAGTISSNGAFVAPKVRSNTPVTITATTPSDSSLHANAAITVTPQISLAIGSSILPAGKSNTPYDAALSATGGISPYKWSLIGGTLPSGLQLQTSSGAISGMTGLVGSYTFTVKATDASGQSVSHAFTLTVASGSTTGFDGPAELPRIYIETAMSATPAPGAITTVNAGGDFQAALNSANCGDTIQLQAGATFIGAFNFPAKGCDDNHWIIVRTSAPDSSLPAEGNRLTPCYAGVSSLPGRPSFHCASTQNVLAKLVMPMSASGPIVFLPGSNHYRLIGLEVTRTPGSGIVYALASVATTGGTADHLILDRVWFHGTAQDETKKGFLLGGMSYASAIDSYFSDLHCTSVAGACTDASAVGGGDNDPVGPFKIVNNFLEASGENILMGGAQASTTPADIQISQNHFFKPLAWLQGQPGYVGGAGGHPFIVKNFLELKNAQRVLIEANIMEYTWGGFSQNGYAMVLTPANQSNECPLCQVTDITIRYNSISHVGAGLQIANILSDTGGAALEGQRYSIHDITIDDINQVMYAGSGKVAEIMRWSPAPPLQNVSISHVTAFPSLGLFSIGTGTDAPMANFNFTNNIFVAGTFPVWSTGGTVDCANLDKPLSTFNACFNPYSFVNNALIASPSGYSASMWPSNNFFPATASAVQFVNYNNGNGGNYQLLSTSPYHGAGTDGKDLGADVSTILSETVGVY